ncbi:MAG: dienelactone hydrolase, partial [Candidatus Promineifilaceae bacterium]
TPPDIWKDFDPDAGDFNEEIIDEKTEAGIYTRESYISAYVNGTEIRVFCTYAVKAGAKNAPGLMNVHGWMGRPAIDNAYVNDGWAVMAHDYSGIRERPHHTKYPPSLCHGNMNAKEYGCSLIYSKMPDGSFVTAPTQTSHYLWNAIQRRVVSYLLAQKEVDPDRLGAKGFSYGGTIMWNLGMDPRVKATVAYFGIGWIEYYRTRGLWKYQVPSLEPTPSPGEALFLSAVAPQAHAPYITAASLWLNGSNDHHGGHERAGQTFEMFRPDVPWDFAVQARGHHNTDKLGDDCKLWLEKHVLKKDHFWPARPTSEIKLDAAGVPEFLLTPADPERIKELHVYQCLKAANNIERYWRDVKAERKGDTWIAKLPVMNVDDYVFSYANIRYDNDSVVSSDFEAVIPSELGNAVATDTTSDALPGGADRWSHAAPAEGVGGISGFRPIDNHRGTSSGQFSDPKWRAPRGADLSFKFYCTQPQTLALKVNGGFTTEIDITASDVWQRMTIKATQLKQSNGATLADWADVKNIAFKPSKGSDITKVVLAQFEWTVPDAKTSALPKADKDGKTYLTKEAASYVESFWRVLNDKGVEGKPLSVGGKKYARGLGVHAKSVITFPLNGQFAAFHVVPGPDDAHKGLLEMKILVDGKEVFASSKISSAGYKAEALDMSVAGAKELTLVVTDAGNGKGGDHASWADAYLMAGVKVSQNRKRAGSGDPFLDPFANPEDDPALARVLIIGDSISIGYTAGVRKLLSGKANVHRVKGNCQYSAVGVERIDTWLGNSDWDLIHFNFGLWDWYGWSQVQKATPESYAANLDQIVTKIKATEAKLIFALTTPPCVGPEKKVEIVITEERAKAFRDVALAVMKKHGVDINDLYTPFAGNRAQYQRGPDNVHYGDEGKTLQARLVATTIEAALANITPSAVSSQEASAAENKLPISSVE